jgi:hypothetical protein
MSATFQKSKKPREIPIYNCGYVCNVFLNTFTAKLKNLDVTSLTQPVSMQAGF